MCFLAQMQSRVLPPGLLCFVFPAVFVVPAIPGCAVRQHQIVLPALQVIYGFFHCMPVARLMLLT